MGLDVGSRAVGLEPDAQGADGARHVGLAAGGSHRDPGGALVDLGDFRLEAVVGEFEAGGAEGVGLEDVRAGFQVGLVDVRDQLGLLEDDLVVALVDVDATLVEHGAHGAVEDDDAIRAREEVAGVFGGHGLGWNARLAREGNGSAYHMGPQNGPEKTAPGERGRLVETSFRPCAGSRDGSTRGDRRGA
ncbi:hypothetical protein D3C72_699720 [compost metagenome]